MAIEKRLGTEDNPDIRSMGSAVEVQPDTTREDQIREAAEILVSGQEVLIDDEILPEESQIGFNANLAASLSLSVVITLSSIPSAFSTTLPNKPPNTL